MYIRQQLDKRLNREKQGKAADEPAKPDNMYAIPAALRVGNNVPSEDNTTRYWAQFSNSSFDSRSLISEFVQAFSSLEWDQIKPCHLSSMQCILQTQKVNQEDVSAWMTGIVEVPLSVVQRLKNVEETEEAKRKLLDDSSSDAAGLDPAPAF